MIISYSTPIIFSSAEDEAKLFKTLELQRVLFDRISEIHFGSARNSIVELHAKVYRKMREEFPEAKSQLVIRAENAVISAYTAAKSSKHHSKKPHKRKGLEITLDTHLYRVRNGFIEITTLEKRVSVKPHIYPKLAEALSLYKLGDPSLFVRNGRIHINLPFEVPEKPVSLDSCVGVDLGINRYAATSTGKLYKDKEYNKNKRKIRYLRARLQSKGTKSAKRHLRKIKNKERNSTKNFCHHLANRLIDDSEANIIVLEDLKGIKKNVKKKIPKYLKLGRIAQVPFYKIRQFLTYKAPLYGKRVVTVNPSFTSQIDHQTGRRSGKRMGCRYITRKKLVYDADINAAINIAKRSKLPFSPGNPLDGQAEVIQPIVVKHRQVS